MERFSLPVEQELKNRVGRDSFKVMQLVRTIRGKRSEITDTEILHDLQRVKLFDKVL